MERWRKGIVDYVLRGLSQEGRDSHLLTILSKANLAPKPSPISHILVLLPTYTWHLAPPLLWKSSEEERGRVLPRNKGQTKKRPFLARAGVF